MNADNLSSSEVQERFYKNQPNGIVFLLPAHLEDLRKSGLSDKTISKAGIRSFSSENAEAALGFPIESGGMLIPYPDPNTGEESGFIRIKPDIPPIIEGKPAKYLSPKGSGNHLYVPPGVWECLKENPTQELVITEGEKKALKASQEGLACVGVAGVWCWHSSGDEEKKKLLPELLALGLKRRPVTIVYDSDAVHNPHVRHAEFALASELKCSGAKVSIKRLLPSEKGIKTGLDDFLCRYSVMDFHCLPSSDPFLYHEVEDIFNRQNGNSRKRKIANTVLRAIMKHGYFASADKRRLFFFDQMTRSLYALESSQFEHFLCDLTGLNPTDTEFKYLVKEFEREASVRGEKVCVHSLSYYDEVRNLLYINRFNGRLYRLDGKTVEEVDNGTDGVLCLALADEEPFTYQHGEDVDDYVDRFILSRFSAEDGDSLELQQFLLLVFLLAMFFQNLLPTRPILVFTGHKGSGKTMMLKIIGRLLFGKNFNVVSLQKDREDDFIAIICSRFFVGLDNVDTGVSWLNDHLARAATGQKISKRKYYTTNELVEFFPNVFIALSSRTPHFRRDDVVERLLIFRTARLEEYAPSHVLLEELDQNRDKILTELLNALNGIVAAIPSIPRGQVKQHRMADFADLGWRVATILGDGDRFVKALDLQAKIQTAFLLEEDPLLLAISRWLERAENRGRRVDAAILHEELSLILHSIGHPSDYKNPLSLAKRLSNVHAELSSLLGIKLTIQKHTHGNQNAYVFQKVSEFNTNTPSVLPSVGGGVGDDEGKSYGLE